MRGRRAIVIAVALATVVVGCSDAQGVDRGDAAPPSAGAQEPRRVPVETVDLSADGRTVTLGFVGTAPFAQDDPCTADYAGSAEVTAGELAVSVVVTVDRFEHGPSSSNGGECSDLGHRRTVTARLGEPYTGVMVRDLAGYVRFLGAPDGLAELAGLPDGWELRASSDLPESPTGRWARVYSPLPDPGPGDPRVELIQAFDAPAGVSGGDEQRTVRVGAVEGLLYRHAPTGELVLAWRPGPNGLALVANERHFGAEDLVVLAETAQFPE